MKKAKERGVRLKEQNICTFVCLFRFDFFYTPFICDGLHVLLVGTALCIILCFS